MGIMHNLIRRFIPQKHPNIVKDKYNIPDNLDWDIQLTENGLIATSKKFPGIITNGDNPQELLEMINDAVLEYFDVPKLESDFVFDKLNVQGRGTVVLKQAEPKHQHA